MKSFDKLRTGSVAAGMLLASLAMAQGQQAQQTPRQAPAQRGAPPAAHAQTPATNEAPQRTTASYGDWVVQCVANNSSPPEQTCDMAQVTQLQGKNLPFSRVAVAHPEKDRPVKLIVQVPVNVSFATQVRIQTADPDPGFAVSFATCTPNGCFAEFDLKDDMLKKLREATSVGKLSFADAGGHDVVVPISFNGFSQAFEALAKK